jgi:hypothetical protein
MTAGGEVEFVNQQILDYTGETIEESRDWRPLVHPDDLALLMTRWMRSIETGDAYEVEHLSCVPTAFIAGSTYAGCRCGARKVASYVGITCLRTLTSGGRQKRSC